MWGPLLGPDMAIPGRLANVVLVWETGFPMRAAVQAPEVGLPSLLSPRPQASAALLRTS